MSSPNQPLRKPFQKINIITSSVNSINFAENDIKFEKRDQNKNSRRKEELKWSENDVDFTTFNAAKCPYEKCLVNDDIVRAFNNFQVLIN